MKITTRTTAGMAVTVLALVMGVAGSASAGAGTTYCGYRATGGTQQWTRTYVGNRQCPATDTFNGVQGTLVSREYIA